jgi:hypothetical protein
MTKPFAPHLSILPEAQRRLWVELGDTPDEFVLYGGTAIALHLGHRHSVDFDFFADCHIDPVDLYKRLAYLKGARLVRQEPDTLTCLVDRGDPVSVSFFGLPNLNRLRPPHVARDTRLKVASLLDLAGTKALVVQRRAQAKDYIDLDALITAGIDLPQALAAARNIYGPAFEPTPTLKALTYFDDGDLTSLPGALRQRLVRAAAAVDPLRLPSLKRTATRSRRPDRNRDR